MKAKNYIVLTDEKGDVEGFASFLEREIPHTHKGQNVIVNLLKYKNLKPQQLIKFIEISNSHRKTKQSFVLVSGAIDPDETPTELMVVPTLQEAVDVVEMEGIERDLGF